MENTNEVGTTENLVAMETPKPVDQLIKEIRQNQDAIIKAIKIHLAGREASLAITSLERSRMFLGKTLGAYGNPNPYPTSYDPTSTTVEKTADEADFGYFADDLEGVLLIKYFRKAISDDVASPLKIAISDCYNKLKVPSIHDPMWFFNYFGTAMMLAEEAAMWLGMMLQDYAPKSEVVFQSESDTPTQQKVRMHKNWNGDLNIGRNGEIYPQRAGGVFDLIKEADQAGGFKDIFDKNKIDQRIEKLDKNTVLDFAKRFPDVMLAYCQSAGYYFDDEKQKFFIYDEEVTEDEETPGSADVLAFVAQRCEVGFK